MIRKLPREKRAKKRGSLSLPVTYTAITEVHDTQEETTSATGTTADLSDSGLGLFTNRELKPGTILEIECRDLWISSKQFTVQWCHRIQPNFYRIGLATTK